MKRTCCMIGLVVLIVTGLLVVVGGSDGIPRLYGLVKVQGDAEMVVDAEVGGGIETTYTSWGEGEMPDGFVVFVADVVSENALREALLGQGMSHVDLTQLVDPLVVEILQTDLRERYSDIPVGTAIPDLSITFGIDGVVAVLDEQFVFQGTVWVSIVGQDCSISRDWKLEMVPLLFGIWCEDFGNCDWSWSYFQCKKNTTGPCGRYWNAISKTWVDMKCEYHLFRGGCVCCR